jgi:16S rRNA (uracil1498-N3)-methyltransferase
VKSKRSIPKESHSIQIAVAPTKNHDRLEWFVEKATEIGVDRIIPIECRHNERKKINHERLQKVAISAMKQSLKAWLPDVQPLTTLEQAVTSAAGQKFISHLAERPAPHLSKIAKAGITTLVLIGPEGGFTDDEVQMARRHGCQIAILGPHRLRTETAALVACHTLNLLNADNVPQRR